MNASTSRANPRWLAALVTTSALSVAAVASQGCGSDDSNSNGSTISGGGKGGGNGAGASTGDGDASTGGTEGGLSFITGGSDAGPPPIPEDSACHGTPFSATPRKVNMLLVVDESGSMTTTPTGFTSDKWTALKSAMGTSLDAAKSAISFGLELYPASADPTTPIPVGCTTNCCEMPAAPGITVPVEAGATGVPKILAALDATSPGGGTPTALALSRALDYYTVGKGKALTGDKYVLLATDGGPNCNTVRACAEAECTLNIEGTCPAGTNCCDAAIEGPTACLDDAATEARIADLNKAGVKTFVVGLPGTEAYETALDAFAVAGGEVNPNEPPKYFQVAASGGVAGLSAVLESITKTLITTCRLVLASEPPDRNLLDVYVDGTRIPKGTVNGWELDTTTTPPTVVLKGTTCSSVESNGAETAEVRFGCPPLIPR